MTAGILRGMPPFLLKLMSSGSLFFGLSLVSALLPMTTSGETFSELKASISKEINSQPEKVIHDLLLKGLEEGKPSQSIAVAKAWLRRNLPANAMFLYQAARAAELSGDWKGAVALYRRYLEQADLKTDSADNAVYAVYSILLDFMKDEDGAYVFGRSEGNRFMLCPRAKQFDQWFLDQTVRRRDAIALTKRLNACIQAGLPNDLLIARYSQYFRWLLTELDGYLEQGRKIPVTDQLLAACKQLTGAMKFDEEIKLRLDWAISVRSYNLARIAQKEIAPPVVEAKALLSKFPRFAKWVQDGWAGGGNGRYYRNDPKFYWPHEIEQKMEPIIASIPKLTPLELADLTLSWQDGFYQDKTVRPLLVKTVREYLLTDPIQMNKRFGVILSEKPWNELTPKEARDLASRVSKNQHPDASLIRSLAVGGEEKNFDKALAALIGPEAWRLPQHHDQRNVRLGALRKAMGAQNNEEQNKKWAALGGGLKTVDAKKEDPAAQRIAVFRKLWNDYNSPQPKLPSVYERLSKVLRFTPEVIPELLRDSRLEAQILARNAIANGISSPTPEWTELEGTVRVNISGYAPGILYLAQRHRGLEEMKKRYPLKSRAHPLEPALRRSVTDGLKQNKLEPWQVQAWINMQYPEDNVEQVKLMQALFKSPVWKTMPFEVRFSAREWFKKDAMSPAQASWIDAADPEVVCKELLLLSEDADVPQILKALNSVSKSFQESPVKLEMKGLERLATVPNEAFNDPKVIEQVLRITVDLREPGSNGPFVKRLFALVKEQREPVLIQRTAGYLWPYIVSGEPRSMFEPMKKLTASLMDEHPSSARVLARSGVAALTSARNSYGFNPSTHVPEMKALAGKAAMKLGLVVIPVPKDDPTYPVYKSQADWMTESKERAWVTLNGNWDQLLPVHRDLSVGYLNWILQRLINARDEDRQKEIVEALLAWTKEPVSPFTLEQRIELEMSYAEIAVQRGLLDSAKEIFNRIRSNKEYENLPLRHQATLRKARVERAEKNYDAALLTLSELEFLRIPEMWAPVLIARAEVLIEMEEFDDAKDGIEKVLLREPRNESAKIIRGDLDLKMENWESAIDLDIGIMGHQAVLSPGQRLKVTLNDPNLAVTGAGTEAEVKVWTTSGDAESFLLRKFGDSKTKFRGEVVTALGKPSPDDGILQLIGDDRVHFDYTKNFRLKMNDQKASPSKPISVASDAILLASARALLSEDEQRVLDMEERMKKIRVKSYEAGQSDLQAQLRAKEEMVDEMEEEMLRGQSEDDKKREARARVKPGNPIHLRVIDLDRSRTGEVDELVVNVESSSGDSVSSVVLTETGTHTGWFEGKLRTTGAQAMAFARNSEPGRNPNMVISPNENYPSWRPLDRKGARHEFIVDINDNAPIENMEIVAKQDGFKLRKFILQTAMNRTDWTTVGRFPENLIPEDPWKPSVMVMNDTDHHHAAYPPKRSVHEQFDEVVEHFENGWMTQKYAQNWAGEVAGPTKAMPAAVLDDVKWKRQQRHDVSHVIYRFRGYFHEPEEVERRFRVSMEKYEIPENTHSSIKDVPEFMLAINGRPITEKGGKSEGTRKLRPGIHRFEIWATGWVRNMGFGRSVKVQANLDGSQKLIDCPDRFFDPASFPPDSLPHRNGRAEILASEGATKFSFKFQPGSRTRLFRMIFLENEGSVPSLDKITLTQPDGKKILPVANDFSTLNKNDTLEILVNDRVTVRYKDDRFITKGKEMHERFLDVAFTDARVDFEFLEMRRGRGGQMVEYYENLLRFKPGKPIILTVRDADMDVTEEVDSVTVQLEGGTNESSEILLTETEPSSGIFRTTIAPVVGDPIADGQVQVLKGSSLKAIYRDMENVRPGVPEDRSTSIEPAVFATPRIRFAHSTVSLLEKELWTGPSGMSGWLNPTSHSGNFGNSVRRAATHDLIFRRWGVDESFLFADSEPKGDIRAVLGRKIKFQVVAPHLALRKGSSINVYLQTEAGRRTARQANPSVLESTPGASGFDLDVPGTMSLTLTSSDLFRPLHRALAPEVPIYQITKYAGSEEENSFDRFVGEICLINDFLPKHGILSEYEIERLRNTLTGLPNVPPGLVVEPGDKVYLGFNYIDSTGAEKWITGSTTLMTHPVLDVTDEDYREVLQTAHVGENLHLRVVDLGADRSDNRDRVSVLMQAKSGAKQRVELLETDPHSGVFRASYALSLKVDGDASQVTPLTTDSIRREGFPVLYGDVVAIRYTDGSGVKTPITMIKLNKGANGRVVPFTKRFEDSVVAERTQFSLAESYLELARRHRRLGEEEKANLEYAQAKQLLSNTMNQFRDPETLSNAQYILGNLTFEEADGTELGELRKDRFRAALSRFMKVVSRYPDTLYASKAQFKIASVYEKLGEPEIAAQEYVKLAYKYPESEYLATAMAKLGTHFLKKANRYDKEAESLLAKENDEDARFEGTARKTMAVKQFIKTADIFIRLLERFPEHELAGKVGVLAGQALLTAGKKEEALKTFKQVMGHDSYDGKQVRSKAMYWGAKCYCEMNEPLAAYSLFKRITYDFPESDWAAYARGELAEDSMVRLENDLEIERLEELNK